MSAPTPPRLAADALPPPRLIRTAFEGRVLLLQLPGISGSDGVLTPLNLPGHDFQPVRMFLVQAPHGARRGGHGHRQGRQLLVHVSGVVELTLRHGGNSLSLQLDQHANGCLIHAPVWAAQTYTGHHPAIAVLCDTPYDPGNYLDSEPWDGVPPSQRPGGVPGGLA